MTIDMDDEILQDFLVEAGEILEVLGEQLVELEQSPDDLDLLNAIFRGFHTVKGGAGFLSIEALVNVCHQAEDVFNNLRQGDMKVTSALMDVMLQVLDVVNEMFDHVRSGQEPKPATPELLAALQRLTSEESSETAEEIVVPETAAKSEYTYLDTVAGEDQSVMTANAADAIEQEFEQMLGAVDSTADEQVIQQTDSDEITEDEFDDLLDALHGKGGSPTPKEKEKPAIESESATTPGEITENEFEDLLDELHGKGKFSTANVSQPQQENVASDEQPPASDKGDEISDQEFQAVLDEIHGKGKFSGESIQTDSMQEPLQSATKKEHQTSSDKSKLAKPELDAKSKPKPKKTTSVSDIAAAKKSPRH